MTDDGQNMRVVINYNIYCIVPRPHSLPIVVRRIACLQCYSVLPASLICVSVLSMAALQCNLGFKSGLLFFLLFSLAVLYHEATTVNLTKSC